MFISHFLILLILALFFVPSDGLKLKVSMEALNAGWGLAKSIFEFVKNLVSPDKDGKK